MYTCVFTFKICDQMNNHMHVIPYFIMIMGCYAYIYIYTSIFLPCLFSAPLMLGENFSP